MKIREVVLKEMGNLKSVKQNSCYSSIAITINTSIY